MTAPARTGAAAGADEPMRPLLDRPLLGSGLVAPGMARNLGRLGLLTVRDLVFHFPRRKASALTRASDDSATATAMKTPAGPCPTPCARNHANGSSKSQKQPKLMTVGVHGSPAPLKDWTSTIPRA